ncbi:hypothetical protein CENDO_00355 [Corynebacterium endometrii]|uniref:Uncharacterized protein n=1 Tax=Corynebacterium endometrii TaxID=2488819 RepID=A0A4P7QCU9_9CORY|nr:hypothetical protein CENDO_00355 [Corynebacterium endometrii]
MTNLHENELISLIDEFNQELSLSIRAFTNTSPTFAYTEVSDYVSIRLEQEDNAPGFIPLKAEGHTVLGLVPSFTFTHTEMSSHIYSVSAGK